MPFHFSFTHNVWRELFMQVTWLIKQLSLVLGSDKVENQHYKGYSRGHKVLKFRFYIYIFQNFICSIYIKYVQKTPQKFVLMRKPFLLKSNHNLLREKKGYMTKSNFEKRNDIRCHYGSCSNDSVKNNIF